MKLCMLLVSTAGIYDVSKSGNVVEFATSSLFQQSPLVAPFSSPFLVPAKGVIFLVLPPLFLPPPPPATVPHIFRISYCAVRPAPKTVFQKRMGRRRTVSGKKLLYSRRSGSSIVSVIDNKDMCATKNEK